MGAPPQSSIRLARRGAGQERGSGRRLCATICASQAATPVSIRLKLAHQVKFGDRHAVIGSAGCLGSWRKHVDMEWSSEGWFVEITPSSYEKVLEYKFVIALKDGGLLWESGENRILHVPNNGAYEVIAQWDTTQEEAQIIPDPSLTMIWPPLSDEYLTSMAQMPEQTHQAHGRGMDMYKQDREAAAYEAELEAEVEQEKARLADIQKQAIKWERTTAFCAPAPAEEMWTETPRFISQRQSVVESKPSQAEKAAALKFDGAAKAGEAPVAQPERFDAPGLKPKIFESRVPKPALAEAKMAPPPVPEESLAPAPAKPAVKKAQQTSQAERLSTLMALDEERKEIIRIKAVLMELSMAELRGLGRERGVRGDTRAELVELLVAPMRVATLTTNGAAKYNTAPQHKSTNGAARIAPPPPPAPAPPPPETEESRMKTLSQKSMLELRTLARARGLRGDTKKELVELLARSR